MTKLDPRTPVVVAAVRTPVGRAPRGALREVRPDALAALTIRSLVERVPDLDVEKLDDVILGCAFPEGSQGMNVARTALLLADLPVSVPAMTINRFCSSGLQSIAMAADRILAGNAHAIIAGGVECMSAVPLGGIGYSPSPEMVSENPDSVINMGLTAERVAKRWEISREDQDAFALRSHERAARAIDEGWFRDEICPVDVTSCVPAGSGTKVVEKIFDTDEGPRRDTSLEKLAKLRPVFQTGGTVTAGNTSQTSDGAAALLVTSYEFAESLGIRPWAAVRGFEVAGVEPDIMGIGPIEALPKLFARTGVSKDDVDVYELNEAFAAQALAVCRHIGLDEDKVNPNGGAIALGHPLGATGAKLSTQILHELDRRSARYGVVTMCVGGGMGAAGLFERLG